VKDGRCRRAGYLSAMEEERLVAQADAPMDADGRSPRNWFRCAGRAISGW
jgi:hypothetical protein